MKNKAVFIDRDGTINVDKGYVHKIEDFELIPGSLEALQLLAQAGIDIYIVTNQAGIAKGYYTEEEFIKFTELTLQYFSKHNIHIKEVLYCPHHPDGIVKKYSIACECRKPGTKLIKEVLEKIKIPLQNIALIGDKNSDIEAGNKLKIKTYLIENGHGIEEKAKATHIVANLKEAVCDLVSNLNL